MKKLLTLIFVCLPVLAFAASPGHTTKSTASKTVKTAVKKAEAKKTATPKTATKASKEKVETPKANLKKSAKIVEAKKLTGKKDKMTHKTAKAESSKAKNKQAETHKKQDKVKTSAKKEKVSSQQTETGAVKQTAPKATKSVTKSVVVPSCNDQKVFAVLSDAFRQQGQATHTQMTVKQITQARETQSYPDKGIRSCHSLVETNGVKYETDYSVILNDQGFFVQVENAQPAHSRF